MLWLEVVSSSPQMMALFVIICSAILALIVELSVIFVALPIANRTRTEADEQVIGIIRRPLTWSCILGGLGYATILLDLPVPAPTVLLGCLASLAVVMWTGAALRISNVWLAILVKHQDRFSLVRPRTLPIFDIAARSVILCAATYFVMLAWHIDVTAWLASAGIVGIAVGFAAKDTLANLFAGVFILADAPYKLGDFLTLESGERGRVTEIGMRSTRILTTDDIEIIVPNAQMANARIVNESSGPYEMQRMSATVQVEYGCDLDYVREVLVRVGEECDLVVRDIPHLKPHMHVVEFADSGITVELRVWIHRPEELDRAVDALNTAIYKAFHQANIGIPYPVRDVILRQDPS